MSTTSRRTYALLVAAFVVSMAASQARAWDPPGGRDIDQADHPPTPTTLLRQAHAYIIQNGISVLHNDGYWFAAQFLRDWQQELLNGVRYADVYRGRGTVELELCPFNPLSGLFDLPCKTLESGTSFPIAGMGHFFNPDTGQGLDIEHYKEIIKLLPLPEWASSLLTGGLAYLHVDIEPSNLSDVSPSALELFEEEYANALNAYFDGSAPSIGGRQGTALAMFYLGWASHFLQDLTVVHHTFDAIGTNHNPYEAAADGLGETFAPVAGGHKRGIYEDELPVDDCLPGSRTCFPAFAAHASHDPVILQAAADGDYSHIHVAIPFAQSLQAGLYAAFLTDIGLRPVHMSAVIAAL